MAKMEYQILKMSPCLLILLLLFPGVLCICPHQCTCSEKHRRVDCSGRNLTVLPPGLQENIVHLNLSSNLFTDLHNQLTQYTNLRTLDVSNNMLERLPEQLPRSLWEMYATNNAIKLLDKSDTAYQWNLQRLDVSKNMVERVVLIKNTLSSLQFLNLSSNKLWTVPTNMPSNIKTVDLSNNSLTQILPGTLVKLINLTHLYLHNNKFTYIPDQAFDQLSQLQVITLYNNRWACDDKQNVTYLLKWVLETTAQVVGSPCSNHTTPWQNLTEQSTLSAMTSSMFAISSTQATEAISSLSLETQHKVTKIPKQYRTKESTLSATPSKSVVLTGTDKPLVLYPEGLPTGKANSHEAAAATLTIHIQDATVLNASFTSSTKSSTTPMTLSITSGMPSGFSEMAQQSTTLTLRREETTTNALNARLPSAASIWKANVAYVLMVNVIVIMVMLTG
ncbi:oligodendrocyte-myelin glycoprotein [Trichosurus vulpecula]|uniref:oligodendrocyte-myelin glycoprotein n=1 Tax=Trichosurus vulpecula TaxID=9337 RepID=UPI00186B4588|nr:oligodendrocyte-myelin glycoprotein [Trichosurus vulpecula]